MKHEQGLFVTATPIGNLGDISQRALDVLRSADVIACEDTRVTGKLLKAFGIDTPTIAYHEHNADRVRPALLNRLASGQTVALVSDAGTPLISDPGYKLVKAATEAGITVRALPGPSAVLAALSVAGLPTDRFTFSGFLPAKAAGRRKALAEIAGLPETRVFFESGQRIAASLKDMADVFGDARPASVCRELTKLHEEVRRGTLGELATAYAQPSAETRGEFVIVVAGHAGGQTDRQEIDRALAEALQTLSLREAAHAVAYMTGAPKRQVYQRALEMKEGRTGSGEAD